jgi:hypothetical protein
VLSADGVANGGIGMRIVARLRDTAHRMKVTAEYLNFYGDHSGLAVQHAAELAGAAEIVGEWADELEKEEA